MIYFDNSSTTRPAPETVAAMRAALEECWGNPSSLHDVGLSAEHIVRDARKAVMNRLGAKESDGRLLFTAGGTEANNTAVFGSVLAKTGACRVVSTGSEHSSIHASLLRLQETGHSVVMLSTKGGTLDLDELKSALTPQTRLVTLMLVNNETGAVYDIPAAFRAVRAYNPKIVTHCDATQAFGKIAFSPKSLNADLVTVSAHKIHGPKGVGALFVSKDALTRKAIVPYLLGGQQEDGLRGGTENVPGIAGFGAAAKLPYDVEAVKAARDYLLAHLPEGVAVNQPPVVLPAIVSLRVDGVKSETMLHYLSQGGVYVSTGSACSSHSRSVSRALTEFGLTAAQADSTLRVSMGDDVTTADCDVLLELLESGRRRFLR